MIKQHPSEIVHGSVWTTTFVYGASTIWVFVLWSHKQNEHPEDWEEQFADFDKVYLEWRTAFNFAVLSQAC